MSLRVILLLALLILLPLSVHASTWQDLIEEGDRLFDLSRTSDEFQEAINIVKKALDLKPDHHLILWRLGKGYLLKGDALPEEERLVIYEKGRDSVERALEFAPDCTDSLYWYAALLGRIGQTRGILQSLFMVKPMQESLERVIELDPEYASAYYVLSMLYMEAPGWPLSVGNKSKSLEYALLAVALDPNEYDFQYNLAVVYLDNNKEEKAQMTLEHLLLTEEVKEDEEKREEVLELLSSI